MWNGRPGAEASVDSAFAALLWRLLRMKSNRFMFQPRGGIEPLPTTLRPVSGTNSANGTTNMPARMSRNQKIHRQPRNCVKSPPTTGAIAGANLDDTISKVHSKEPENTHIAELVAQPIQVPLSELVAISATTAEPKAIVLDEPVDCKQRKISRATKVLLFAIPRLAPR